MSIGRCHNTQHRLIVILLLALTQVALAEAPAILQAKVYQPGSEVTEYWVSEKLDGVRARWNGRQLLSKKGHSFPAPAWFVKGFPDTALDGELWSARGEYQKIISIVSREQAHEGWRQIKFMVFDLPDDDRSFTHRLAQMQVLATQSAAPYLDVIEQFRVANEAELMQTLDKVVAEGGEGLMLHHQDARYHPGRSQHLLKLKPYQDAEAVVIGYTPGKGQFTGKMGAIKVRTDDNKEFYIGSGFTVQQRENPPPLGARITFRHQNFTDSGIPRFAVFLRIRHEP
ncbi:MAG: DNA ligase [Methylococcales bacterium]|nr:DNA ligase [Methylococcales bacterium]